MNVFYIVTSTLGFFLAWTLYLYLIHRIIHKIPALSQIHWDHHLYVIRYNTGWHWSNLFLFNDTWTSTLDLWITEVIPTLLFSWLTGQWWLSVFYYIWAAFFQEPLEHNPKINISFLTTGQWHLLHHRNPKVNFGLFFSIWDQIFRTEKKLVARL